MNFLGTDKLLCKYWKLQAYYFTFSNVAIHLSTLMLCSEMHVFSLGYLEILYIHVVVTQSKYAAIPYCYADH